MNLRELEIFRAIMLGGSITEAANMLNVSQPAVSIALRHAEDKLGVALFLREKGRIHPTKEALDLYPEIESLFEKIDAIKKITAELGDNRTGVVTIACTSALAHTILPSSISKFRSEHSGVRVLVEVSHTLLIIEMARKGSIDIGFIQSPAAIPLLRSDVLEISELVCVLPNDHPLADKLTLGPLDLVNFPLIVNVRNFTSSHIEEIFRTHGIERDFVIACNQTLMAAMLVEEGAGIAIVDPWISRNHFPGLLFKPFRPAINMSCIALHSQSQPMSRLATGFLDVVKEDINLSRNELSPITSLD